MLIIDGVENFFGKIAGLDFDDEEEEEKVAHGRDDDDDGDRPAGKKEEDEDPVKREASPSMQLGNSEIPSPAASADESMAHEDSDRESETKDAVRGKIASGDSEGPDLTSAGSESD